MFFWGSATRNTYTREAITAFQQSNPGVTISSQYTGNNIYYVKLDAQINADSAPDLIQMDMRYIAQYVRKNTLMDLSQSIYSQAIDLSDFDAALLASSKVNNSIYGIPLGSNYLCMFYDKTELAKANIGPLPTDMTWDTFATYTAELTNALGGATYGTADDSGNYDLFEIWIRQRGKEMYTQEGNLDFELADAADWYNYWSNLRKTKACVPANLQAKLDLTKTPTDSSVTKGKAVFGVLFSNQYDAFQAATPHTLSMLIVPKGNVPGVYLKASQLLSVSETTKYPDEAVSFTNFVINDPRAIKALGFERGVPGSAEARAILQPQLTPAQQVIAAFMTQVANSGETRPKEVLDPPGAGQIATVLLQVSQDIGLGKVSVSAGAKEFYAGAQKATTS